MSFRPGRKPALSVLSWSVLAIWAVASDAAVPDAPQPLAVVNEDTLTTRDLQLELNVMLRRVARESAPVRPQSAAVLSRLVQNFLLVQEGYRMGIDERFVVRNQVQAIVRDKSMTALLDSVASSAPTDDLEDRRTAVDAFIMDLKRSYEVEVDSLLLASLDYGSTDQEVYEYLRDSDEVLATMTGRVLRVRGLTQTIRWKEFHGLGGRPDAAEMRDEIFSDWLKETLVVREAAARGFGQRPEIAEVARAVERSLVHEETFRALIQVDYEPTEAEIEAYYRDHLDEFTAPPRIKLQSVMLSAEEPARKFRERLQQGAKVSWLAKQTPEVVEGPPPFSADWYLPEQLGVRPEDAVVGFVPEPFEVPGGGWIVAMVADVEDPTAQPLEQCRRQIQAMIKGEHVQNTVIDVVSRLEAAADVRILPGAEEIVDRHLDAAFASLKQD